MRFLSFFDKQTKQNHGKNRNFKYTISHSLAQVRWALGVARRPTPMLPKEGRKREADKDISLVYHAEAV